MENNLHFGSLSPRMQAYRESVLQKKPYIDAQRALLATEAYRQSLNETPVMKRAQSPGTSLWMLSPLILRAKRVSGYAAS